MPRTLRYRKEDGFMDLEQSETSVAAYKDMFYAFSGYATQLVTK